MPFRQSHARLLYYGLSISTGVLFGIPAAWVAIIAIVVWFRGWGAVGQIPRNAWLIPDLPDWFDSVDAKLLGTGVVIFSLVSFGYGGSLAQRYWVRIVQRRYGWTDREVETFLENIPK